MTEQTNKDFTLTCGACPVEHTFAATAEQLAHGFTDEELRREGFVVVAGTSYCMSCAERDVDEDAPSAQPEIYGVIRAPATGLLFERAFS